MDIDLTAFHFLRPAWLWLLVPAVALPFLWLRRHDVRARWRNLIEPDLLEHLIVGERARRGVQPVHTLGVAIALGAIAAAGPAWEEARAPFSQDKAPLVVVLELAQSMNAVDIAPSRLERARQKVLDLAAARKGARTGLVVFAATAHLVVPPTEDPAMLQLYVPALDAGLMPRDGKNAAAGLALAETVLAKDPAAGTIVLIGDGFDESHADTFIAAAKQSKHQILWLAVGTANGGPIRGANGAIATDEAGRPRIGGFDAAAIEKVTHTAGIPLASLRADDDDIEWIERRAQTFLMDAQASQAAPRWKEAGYWLVFALLAVVLAGFRRGWTVKWLAAVLLCATASIAPREAEAAPGSGGWRWIDLFATHDQQGRAHFERGDFAGAAARFDNPLWKGRAQYLAGDYAGALASFSALKTAGAYFYAGNALAHLKDYAGAITAFDNALALQPAFPEARANRALMQQLLTAAQPPDEDGEAAPPDPSNPSKKGKGGQRVLAQEARPTDDIWMRNLNTSPAVFLQQRFAQESGEGGAANPVEPNGAAGGAP